MHALSRFAITAVFTLTCFTVPVDAAVAVGSGLPINGTGGNASGLGAVEDPNKAVVPAGPEATVKPPTVDSPTEPADPSAPTGGTSVKEGGQTGSTSGSGAEAGTRIDLGSGVSLADQVRSLQEVFKREQKEVLTRYQDLLKQAKDAKGEERTRLREQIRMEYQQVREDLIERQKVLREEIRRRFEEFKKEHPEHLELIDDAKERLKDKVRDRRGYRVE